MLTLILNLFINNIFGRVYMTSLLRSIIDCIANTVSPLPTNIIKYDYIPSQRTSIILVYI
jgi:hypothetical protein